MDIDPTHDPYLQTEPPEELDFFNDALAEHLDRPSHLDTPPWRSTEIATEEKQLDERALSLGIVASKPASVSDAQPGALDLVADVPIPSIEDVQDGLQPVADVLGMVEGRDQVSGSLIALQEEVPDAQPEAIPDESIPNTSTGETKDLNNAEGLQSSARGMFEVPEAIIAGNDPSVFDDAANHDSGETHEAGPDGSSEQTTEDSPELVAAQIVESLVALAAGTASEDLSTIAPVEESRASESAAAADPQTLQPTLEEELPSEALQKPSIEPGLENPSTPWLTTMPGPTVVDECEATYVPVQSPVPHQQAAESLQHSALTDTMAPNPAITQDLTVVHDLDDVVNLIESSPPSGAQAPDVVQDFTVEGAMDGVSIPTPMITQVSAEAPVLEVADMVAPSSAPDDDRPVDDQVMLVEDPLVNATALSPTGLHGITRVVEVDAAEVESQAPKPEENQAGNSLQDLVLTDALEEVAAPVTTTVQNIMADERCDAGDSPFRPSIPESCALNPTAASLFDSAGTAASDTVNTQTSTPFLQPATLPPGQEARSPRENENQAPLEESLDLVDTSLQEQRTDEMRASFGDEPLDRMGDDEPTLTMVETTPQHQETPIDIDHCHPTQLFWKASLRSGLVQEQTPDTQPPQSPFAKVTLAALDLITPSPSSSSRALSVAPCSPDGPITAKQRNLSVQMPSSTLVSPASYYEPFEAPAPELSEWKVVDALCREYRRTKSAEAGDVEFDLDDFAVYVDSPRYPNEMRCLHFLDTRPGHSNCYFDGRLSVGKLSYFVRRVPIAALPIDGYMDPEVHTVQDSIWLQSAHNSRREVYYRLGKPAKEYVRFHEPFLWVADLAKHFVDFLNAMELQGTKVTMHCFTRKFSKWLLTRHGTAREFLRWGRQHQSGDFRTSVAANIDFLYKEAYGVLGHKKLEFHSLWKETTRFNMIKREPSRNATHDPTLVTEYIRDCFSHLPFGDRLECIPFSDLTKKLRRRVIRKRRLEMPAPLHNGAAGLSTTLSGLPSDIKPGDTISTHRDGAESGTQWKREISKGFQDVDRWFARVQKVTRNRRGKRVFDVIWYYRPVDTLCGLMKYPWGNELFLSDHCSCDESAKITEDEILAVHDVDLWATSATEKELFCRQTYIASERKWISLEKRHLQCEHVREEYISDEPTYRVGETVLVRLNYASDRSEPCEIARLDPGADTVLLRRLWARRDVDPSAPAAAPNELVWTTDLIERRLSRILSKCHIRVFPAETAIPAPYDRHGVGSFFYMTHQITADSLCIPLEEPPATLRQGFDPHQGLPRLRGLDLFCGGGNFGRGLEDGGAVEMRWLNDYNEQAIHTYMANVADPEAVNPFLGSIDNMQRQAMLGKFSKNVPQIGEVDFISAGSPCPGFSNLTNDKTTVQQRKNQSLVAAFGSFVDLYRPQYGLLENVRGIVQKKANRDQDVFSQLICAVMGLGYQTQFFFLDASSCGSPQSRPRVFLVFAAPGCRLPNKPPITHSHPPATKSLSLGLLPNGEPMTEREMPNATPFKFVSAAEACNDLPPIYDAKPDSCIAFPDHRVAMGVTKDARLQMKVIPTQPWGMNFALAWYGMDRRAAGSGVLTQSERDLFPLDAGKRTVGRTLPNSSAFGRMNPTRPMNTIVTRQSPGDAKNGQQMHWHEPRVITLMEARRAQGFRDNEVLLGSVRDQHRIVGNSVAREVAVALGLMFREAEFGSLTDGEEDLSRLMDVEVDESGGSSDNEEAVSKDNDIHMLRAEENGVMTTATTVISVTDETKTTTSLKRTRASSPSSSTDTSAPKRQRHNGHTYTETFSLEGIHDDEEALDELAI